MHWHPCFLFYLIIIAVALGWLGVSALVNLIVDEVWLFVLVGMWIFTYNSLMSFLASLSDAQKRAVDHHEGPLLVVAGAGSCRPRALTNRIAHLIGEHAADLGLVNQKPTA